MEDILVASVWRNRLEGVTGFLLADGESFLQALEGPEAQVVACYGRILNDSRNTDARLVDLSAIEQRRFPRWSMCGLSLSEMDDSILSPPDIAFEVGAAHAGALLQHLEGVALRYGRRLDALHERLVFAAELVEGQKKAGGAEAPPEAEPGLEGRDEGS